MTIEEATREIVAMKRPHAAKISRTKGEAIKAAICKEYDRRHDALRLEMCNELLRLAAKAKLLEAYAKRSASQIRTVDYMSDAFGESDPDTLVARAQSLYRWISLPGRSSTFIMAKGKSIDNF